MKYPLLNILQSQRLYTEQFMGLDVRPRASDGTFSYMKNMSGEKFPLLLTRKKRGMMEMLDQPLGMIAAGKLAWVDGSTLYYDGQATQIDNLSMDEGMMPKRLCTFGAYVLVFPDGAYYNTVNVEDCGNINRLYTYTGDILYQMCDMDGVNYTAGDIVTGTNPPENPQDGQYWIDTGKDTHALMKYSTFRGEWVGIASVFIKMTAPGIGAGLKGHDVVEVSGAEYTGENDAIRKQIEILNASLEVIACGEDYLIVAGILDQAYTQENGTISADRKAPDMDYVMECNNRLWGCKNGIVNGETLNEIYACALGDFKNWRRYANEAGASYAASVGTAGKFTGAINHRGNPYFFKEHCLHKVFGDQPKNFQIQQTDMDGVKEGSAGSLISVNGVVYYHGVHGVMMLDGMPQEISKPLGETSYKNACAGVMDDKYYLSMEDESGGKNIFYYDLERGLWYREDEKKALAFATIGEECYMLADDGEIWALNGTKGTEEGKIPFEAYSAVFGYEYADKKYVSRFDIRLKLGARDECTIYLEYDSSGVWEKKGVITGGDTVKTVTMPILPRRCDHMRLRLKGVGKIELYSIARVLELGADG